MIGRGLNGRARGRAVRGTGGYQSGSEGWEETRVGVRDGRRPEWE